MPKKNVARLKAATTAVRQGDKIAINVDDAKQSAGGDLDAASPVALRVRVKRSANDTGFWGLSLAYFGKLNGAPPDYTANEIGVHVLVLTYAENGVAQTYRSNPIQVT
jgi:hypothetical protein